LHFECGAFNHSTTSPDWFWRVRVLRDCGPKGNQSRHLEESGLEINLRFPQVRDQVLAKTDSRQEPYLYASLPSKKLSLKPASAR
jgi:hypothetical protein